VNLVVPSKRGGGSEVASKGVGRCSFTVLYNPHNNISKQSSSYHKIQRVEKWKFFLCGELRILRHLRSSHWCLFFLLLEEFRDSASIVSNLMLTVMFTHYIENFWLWSREQWRNWYV